MPISLALEALGRNRLHEEDSRRRRVPELALLARLGPCLDPAALLCFVLSLLVTSSTSPSESELSIELCVSSVTGTAPYELVPSASELRMSNGALDMTKDARRPKRVFFRG